MPRETTRGCTRASLRTTVARPTAVAPSPSQVCGMIAPVWVFLEILSVWGGSYVGVCVFVCVCVVISHTHLGVFPEATSITVAPEDAVVEVGGEVVLSCSASYDPMLDVTFIWAIDYRVIDFNAERRDFERIMVHALA